ncbi:MFS transporter [Mycolicibacterium novocastrense]|uniref:MFS transporter n=1 Tax=Mycolicibacterium novocastrense TaxID=59813 RepID=A0AAW5SN49_MYCNV|nr:MFS transporter [Mycolicibacterium novocastrense]MCV7025664.1 MFS transporter [Mycolicibacterium novocastrense]
MDPSSTVGHRASGSRPSTGYGFVLLAVTLAISDFTIADAVIPSLVRDLGLSVADLGLAFTAYFAAAAAFMVLFGRLGDVLGRRLVLLVSTALFIAGSVLSGIAWDLPSFFGGRVLSGLALAATLPNGLGVLNTLFAQRGPQRERAFGLWAAAIGLAAVIGPLVGGAAAATAISWRWAFFGSALLGALAAAGIAATLAENPRKRLADIDVSGAFLLAASAGSLALAVDLGGGYDDQVQTAIGLFGVTIAAAAVFAAVQRRRIRRRQQTIAPPQLFRYKSFRLATFSSAFMSIGDTGFQLALPLVLGFVLGVGQLGVGVVLACYGAGAVLSGPAAAALAKRLDDRTVARYALAALPLLLIGLIGLLSEETPLVAVGAVLVAYGVAWGVAYARLVNMSYYEVPEQDSAVAGGVQSALRLMAGALGAGVLTAVFSGVAGRSALDAAMPSHSRLTPSSDTSALATALSTGAQATIAVAAAITAVALIIAFRLPEQPTVRS